MKIMRDKEPIIIAIIITGIIFILGFAILSSGWLYKQLLSNMLKLTVASSWIEILEKIGIRFLLLSVMTIIGAVLFLVNFFINIKLSHNITPEKIFLFWAIIFGMLFLLLTPPCQVPDEPSHFYRAFQVSELNIIAKKSDDGLVGGFLPQNLQITAEKARGNIPFHYENKIKVNEIFPLFKLPLDSDIRKFVHFPGAALYSPVPYLPQAIGIAIGRFFNSSPLVLFYIGRLFNLFTWVCLVYSAIRLAPFFKWPLVLLALMPMSLFQAASVSADSATNGLSFFLIAITLRYAFDENKVIRGRELCILFLTSILLVFCKVFYFFIPFIFLAIPVKKIGKKKKYFIFFFLLVLLMITMVTAWAFIIKDIYIPLRGSSPAEQLHFIFSNPFKFIYIMFSTWLTNGFSLESFIGNLGWLDTDIRFQFLYFIVLIFISLINRQENIMIKLTEKSIFFTITLATASLISTLLYLSWTEVGSKIINDIQGRYFIPISPLLFLLFYSNRIFSRINENKLNFLNSFLISLCNFYLIWTSVVIFKRYYI